MSKAKVFIVCIIVSCVSAAVAAFAATAFLLSRPDLYAKECARQMGELAAMPQYVQDMFWDKVDSDPVLRKKCHLVGAIAVALDKVEADEARTK